MMEAASTYRAVHADHVENLGDSALVEGMDIDALSNKRRPATCRPISCRGGSRVSAGNFRSKDIFGLLLLQCRHAAMVAAGSLTDVDDRAVIDRINHKWLSSETLAARGINKDAIRRNP
jgi:hypothetical protein